MLDESFERSGMRAACWRQGPYTKICLFPYHGASHRPDRALRACCELGKNTSELIDVTPLRLADPDPTLRADGSNQLGVVQSRRTGEGRRLSRFKQCSQAAHVIRMPVRDRY